MSDCRHCTPCALERIEGALSRMEIAMAHEAEQLNQIKSQIIDVHADVRAKLDEVRSEVSPEGQAAFDEVRAALASFDAEIGDADGSEAPAVGTGTAEDGTTEPAPVTGGGEDDNPPAGEGVVVSPDAPADGGDTGVQPTA